MTIVIASNNSHKVREFQEILGAYHVVSPSFFGLRFEHDETGTTFAENSLGKAKTMYGRLKEVGSESVAVLADDSGIVVPALNGEPGVYSARYGSITGGPELSDADRNMLLLKNMEQVTDRSAYYVCCMSLILGEERFICVQETWHGQIAVKPSSGTGGFGYDPVFIVPELRKTVAEIGADLKSKLSHRAKATRLLLSQLRKIDVPA